jgi:hypothetical protein
MDELFPSGIKLAYNTDTSFILEICKEAGVLKYIEILRIVHRFGSVLSWQYIR